MLDCHTGWLSTDKLCTTSVCSVFSFLKNINYYMDLRGWMIKLDTASFKLFEYDPK